MSEENVKTVRDAFVAYNRGDLDAFLDEYWTDDIDYRAAEGALDDHGPIQGKDAPRAEALITARRAPGAHGLAGLASAGRRPGSGDGGRVAGRDAARGARSHRSS